MEQLKRLATTIALLVAGCGGGGAGGSTFSATISWSPPTVNTDGTPLTDLSAYRVHYGTSAGDLSSSVMVAGSNVNSAAINGLVQGTYYFAVSAVNSTGVESSLSAAVSLTIP